MADTSNPVRALNKAKLTGLNKRIVREMMHQTINDPASFFAAKALIEEKITCH